MVFIVHETCILFSSIFSSLTPGILPFNGFILITAIFFSSYYFYAVFLLVSCTNFFSRVLHKLLSIVQCSFIMFSRILSNKNKFIFHQINLWFLICTVNFFITFFCSLNFFSFCYRSNYICSVYVVRSQLRLAIIVSLFSVLIVLPRVPYRSTHTSFTQCKRVSFYHLHSV